ncbi:MAG: phytanoyl-CoA dioxygenase family protein [Rudaea sp.]
MPICRTKMPASGMLAADAVSAFERDGALIIEDFRTKLACEGLRARANALVLEHGPRAAGTIFSTRQPQHAASRYFVESAHGIGVFFEEEAFDADGRLAYPLPLAVNKLGHALHDLDPLFSAFSKGPALQAVSASLGVADPRVMQSMYIFKQPGIGGEVVCHQDSTYLHTEPMSVVGYWFAIDDAHRGNGCLGGIVGGHRHGLTKIFRRQADGRLDSETRMQTVPWDLDELEWLEVAAGTLIVLHGCFPHLSLANRSAEARHAYTLHAVDARCAYPADNWLQRPTTLPALGFV